MPNEPAGSCVERVEALEAYAREQLGTEIQAITHLGRPVRIEGAPEVWGVMTETGTFWLVERDGEIELFAATAGGCWRRDAVACGSPQRAARRFLELHP